MPLKSFEKPILLIGVPTRGMHSFLWSQSMQGMVMPLNFSMQIRYVPFMEVGRARNILVSAAQEIGAKYLMFIDEDVISRGDALRRLVYHMETHPTWSVCAGVYASKTIPPEPLIFREWGQGSFYGWKKGDMVQVKAVGNGFTMYRVCDFDLLPPEMAAPYEDQNPWTGLPMICRNFFNTGGSSEIGASGTGIITWTEDMYFFRMAEQVGMQVWADTSIELDHLNSQTMEVFRVPIDNDTCVAPEPWKHEPLICNLGAGHDISPYEVSVDLRDDPALTHKCDVRKLPEQWADTFDIVHADHVLEHFRWCDSESILREWVRILKPGGMIQIRVPDIQWAAQHIAEDGALDEYLCGVIWGDQGSEYWMQEPYGGEEEGRFLPHSTENNVHRAGFTRRYMEAMFRRIGLEEVVTKQNGMEFIAWGRKPNGKEEVPDHPGDNEAAG